MKGKVTKSILTAAVVITGVLFSSCDSPSGGLFGGEVPVYQGMSISSAEMVSTASAMNYNNDVMLLGAENGNKDNNGKHNGWYKGDSADEKEEIDQENPFPDNPENENIETEIQSSLEVVGPTTPIYYATLGDDIFINIHIKNPDDFEIQSFTLNGKKYANYMFEAGSTMENIILRYSVGLELGIQEYTIDAIKYIDGTEIKDVRINGEKTVRAAAYSENAVATTVSSIQIGYNEISFTAHISDDEDLVKDSQGGFKAVLYDGETLVATQDLSVGENTVCFNDLKTGGLYQYAIIGFYHNPKTGFWANMLYKEAVYTKSIVVFDNIQIIEDNNISFDFLWDEDFQNKTIYSLFLYKEGVLVETLSPTATKVEGLSYNKSYEIIAEYQNGDKAEFIKLTIKLALEPTEGVVYVISEVGTYAEVIGYNGSETEVVISDTYKGLPVKTIRWSAFGEKGFIVSVTIPDSVTSIDYQAFYYCSSLTSVVIPDSVTSIGSSAFQYCRSLTSIKVSQRNTAYKDIDGNLYTKDGSVLIQYAIGKTATEFAIPDGVTSIGYEAFSGCSSLTSVVIGDGVTSIGNNAFSGTAYYNNGNNWENDVLYIGKHLIEAKTTISGAYTIKEGTLTIASAAFSGCSSLTSVVIPDGVTSIGDFAFVACDSLTSVYYTGDIASWCNISFGSNDSNPLYYAKNLYLNNELVTELVIPNTVTEIKNNAFYGCKSLTSIEIPDSVTSIGDYAFYGCSKLTSVYYTGDIASWCNISFGENASNPLHYAKNLYLNNKLVTQLIIPNIVTEIKNNAFVNCSSLTSVEIPDSVTSIGSYAFSGCSSLTSVEIPDSVTSIGDYAFRKCSNLTSIVIGDSVTSIGRNAFYNCSSLTSIVIPDSVTSIGRFVFYNCSSLTSIKVSKGNTAYKDIDGNLYSKDGKTLIQYAIGKTATEFAIPDSVTSIGSEAFSGCSSLTSVEIPDSVTSIGYAAFEDCSSLTSVEIPDSVTSIGRYAFSGTAYYNNENNWENDVLYIGKHLIAAKETISGAYTIKDGTLIIANYAFRNCSSLTSVVIPDSVTSIGYGAFYYCDSLTSVTFENPNGWFAADSSTATSGTDISSADLSDTATAATYLKSTYGARYWKRSE